MERIWWIIGLLGAFLAIGVAWMLWRPDAWAVEATERCQEALSAAINEDPEYQYLHDYLPSPGGVTGHVDSISMMDFNEDGLRVQALTVNGSLDVVLGGQPATTPWWCVTYTGSDGEFYGSRMTIGIDDPALMLFDP